MDIQRFERDSTRIRYYYTINTSGQVQIMLQSSNKIQTSCQQLDLFNLQRRLYGCHPWIVPEKNGKLKTCIDFRKLNVIAKKDPYPLPFIDEMLNTIARYEAYSFLNGYLRYHQIYIAQEDKYKGLGFQTDAHPILLLSVNALSRLLDIIEPTCVPDQTTYVSLFYTKLKWLKDVKEFLKT